MLRIIIKSIVTLAIVMMLFSCENSITEVQQISRQDSLALVSAYNVVYERTDSGFLQVVLRSPLMERNEGDDPQTVFPDGFEVTFYDVTGKQVSNIKADYGINFEKRRIMKARNDVVVKNFETQEQLNTENLVWDQKKKMIYAHSFIKITTPDKVIYGDSMHAAESFKTRDIFNMRGVFEVEDDSVSTN
jgi:lipopolysaccharide export system protein LptC